MASQYKIHKFVSLLLDVTKQNQRYSKETARALLMFHMIRIFLEMLVYVTFYDRFVCVQCIKKDRVACTILPHPVKRSSAHSLYYCLSPLIIARLNRSYDCLSQFMWCDTLNSIRFVWNNVTHKVSKWMFFFLLRNPLKVVIVRYFPYHGI